MNTTQTVEQMRELRLTCMSQSYQSQLELSINHQLEGHELIAHLVEAEKLSINNSRIVTVCKKTPYFSLGVISTRADIRIL